jgi:ATP-dependent RNA helicase DDX41
MPKKIQDFARLSLTRPVLVNVGRAGAANLDVLQVVEYVKQEAKMVYLLECLQKTPPPVIIFSENKNEVDGMRNHPLCLSHSIHSLYLHPDRYSRVPASKGC